MTEFVPEPEPDSDDRARLSERGLILSTAPIEANLDNLAHFVEPNDLGSLYPSEKTSGLVHDRRLAPFAVREGFMAFYGGS